MLKSLDDDTLQGVICAFVFPSPYPNLAVTAPKLAACQVLF